MQEHRLAVRRTARYFTLGPLRDPRELWIMCHGYGQAAQRFLERCYALDDGTRLLVAPEGLSRFYADGRTGRVGASWMTKDDREHEIADYVAYLDALSEHLRRAAGAVPRSRALGFSQGVATVCRWLALGRTAVDDLVLWGGELPHDLDFGAHADVFRRMRLTVVVGERDEFAPPDVVAREEDVLRRHEIPYRMVRFPGGHRLDDDVLRSLASG